MTEKDLKELEEASGSTWHVRLLIGEIRRLKAKHDVCDVCAGDTPSIVVCDTCSNDGYNACAANERAACAELLADEGFLYASDLIRARGKK